MARAGTTAVDVSRETSGAEEIWRRKPSIQVTGIHRQPRIVVDGASQIPPVHVEIRRRKLSIVPTVVRPNGPFRGASISALSTSNRAASAARPHSAAGAWPVSVGSMVALTGSLRAILRANSNTVIRCPTS